MLGSGSQCYAFGKPLLSTAVGTAKMRLPVPPLLQSGVIGSIAGRSTSTSTVSTTVHSTSVSATTVHHSRSSAHRAGIGKATSTATRSTSGGTSSGTSHAKNNDRKAYATPAPDDAPTPTPEASIQSSRKMMALDSDLNTFYSAFLVIQ
uniref:Uncharacterized protein n=1 Tax=Anopheles farauti TaxID=69004 RepID=A0A182R0X3_9DIPT